MQANTVNYVIYGTNESDANALASDVIGGSQQDGVWVSSHEGSNLRGYVRYVGGSSYTIPQGVTNVIIVHLSTFSDEAWGSLQAYLTERANVPVRIVLTSESSVNEWAAQNGVVVTADQSALRQLAWSNHKANWDFLTNLYNKHAAPEGLNVEGLKALVGEHNAGVEGEHDYLFNHSDNISFHQFYNWWVMGRNDAYYYRGIVDIGRQAPKFAQVLAENFGKIKNVAGSDYQGKLDISSTQEFQTGWKVGFETNFGDHFNTVSQGFSNSQKQSAFHASFEFGINDASKVPEMVARLNQLKEMAREIAVPFKYLLRSGLDFQFRNVGSRFYIDAVISGLFGEMIHNAIPSNVDFNSLQFSAQTTFSVSHGLSPLSAVTQPLEELLRAALNLSIQGTGSFLNIGTISSVLTTLCGILKMREKDVKGVELLMTGFSVLKSIGFEFKYDSLDLFQTVSEMIASATGVQPSADSVGNLQVASQMFAQQQGMAAGFIEQGKAMTMFVADFLPLIQNVNLDSFSASISSNLLRANARFYVELPGITQWVANTFLNQ